MTDTTQPSFYLCPRCTLRKSGQQDLALYLEKNIRKQSDSDLENNPENDKNNEKICFSCLGLLTSKFLENSVILVKNAIKSWSEKSNNQHDIKMIKVAFHNPPTILVTNYLLGMPLDAPLVHKIGKALVHDRLKNECPELFQKTKTESEETSEEYSLFESSEKQSADTEINLKLEHIESEKKLLSPIFDLFPKLRQNAKYVKSKIRTGESQDEAKGINSHKRLKSEFYTEGNIMHCLANTSREKILRICEFEKEDDFNFSWSTTPNLLKTEIIRPSIYVAGRYTKKSRKLPQTPWHIFNNEGEVIEKIAETSVQELLAEKFLPIFHPDSINLCSSGREDVDVRMLGRGRPFTIEFICPRLFVTKSIEDENKDLIKVIQNQVNQDEKSMIGINDLQICDKNGLDCLLGQVEG